MKAERKKIVVVANKYPNVLEPNVCVFIQQLVWSFADMGYDCNVVVPLPINLNKEYRKIPYYVEEKTEKGTAVKVFHPQYVSMGQSGATLQKQRVLFTTKMFERAVDRAIEKMDKKPDVLYSHFLCPAGVTVSRLGKKYGIPAYMAHGEALYAGNEKYGNKRLAQELTGLNGVIAVSSQNKQYVVDAGIVKPDIVDIFPNGYREERFFPRDKAEARARFGFPQDKFIVGMCGSFDERKGVLRLQKAVDQVPDVYFACAGKGEQTPTSEKCLWAKPVNNDELPNFYSALDAFVLPTQNEGCCNAIVEAIACGCPIISSDRAFNSDICDHTNSLLVDPDNVDEIRNAILRVKEDDNLRKSLSEGSLMKSKELTLNERARRILTFMNL